MILNSSLIKAREEGIKMMSKRETNKRIKVGKEERVKRRNRTRRNQVMRKSPRMRFLLM